MIWLRARSEPLARGFCPLEHYLNMTAGETISGDTIDELPKWAQKFVDRFDKTVDWICEDYAAEQALDVLRRRS